MTRKSILVTLLSLLLLGVASAQGSSPPGQNLQMRMMHRAQSLDLGMRGLNLRGLGVPLVGLPMGTVLEISLYDSDPTDAEAIALSAHSLTVGEDSEAAFLQALAEAKEDAAYMAVRISERSYTLSLEDASLVGRRGFALPGFMLGRGLGKGDSISVTFYSGDPDEGAPVLESLSFTYGEDSAIGFANDLAEAAAEAAYAQVTVSAQHYTVQLSLAERSLGPQQRAPAQQRHLRPGRFR